MKRRLRAIGEPLVPLDDRYPLAVTFVIASRRQPDGSMKRAPIGTGFVVNIPTRIEGLSFEYVVTAAHLVCNPDVETWVRIRTRDGGSKDLPVPQWVPHPHADVAAAPFVAGDHTDLHLLHVPASAWYWREIDALAPRLGERVYFLGLLSLPEARSMAERNVPMVRSGTVGASYQNDMPHRWPDGTIRRFQAHLIDCRSYNGFSGSPCFFQTDDRVLGIRKGEPIRGQATHLLGLVSGHFDAMDLDPDEYEGSAKAPVNTGVGLVAPVERIVEVLKMDEFEDDRQRRVQEEQKGRHEVGATLDSVAESELERSEFERFEDLTRGLLDVSKKELDEKRKDEES